jgi:hypothetical protein
VDLAVSDIDNNSENPAEPGQVAGFESDRTSERRKVLKGARIGFNHEFSSVECVIRNLSETGAFVVVNDGILVPNHFTLFNDLDGYKVDCEIVWRHGNSFGVHFVGPKSAMSSKRTQILNEYLPTGGVPEDDLGPQQSQTGNRPRPSARPVFGKRK